MSVIKYLKDIEGTGIFPITHERAVRDSNGVNLETKINRKINSDDFDNIVELTKAQYDALAVKDDRTVYVVSDASGEESEYVSIADVETVPSSAPGGENVTTITLTNGETFEIVTINGLTGPQGNSGYSGAAEDLEVVNNLTDGGTTAALSAEMGKELNDDLERISQELEGGETETKVAVDTTHIDTVVRYIAPSTNKWNSGNSALGIFYPITPGVKYGVLFSENNSHIAPTTNSTSTASTTPSYATGYTERVVVTAGTEYTFVAPEDAAYLFICVRYGQDTRYPFTLYRYGTEYVPSLSERIEGYDADTKTPITYDRTSALSIYLDSEGKFASNSNYETVFIPIEPGKHYTVDETTQSIYTNVGVLKSAATGSGNASFATGFDSRTIVAVGSSYSFTCPEDGHYMSLLIKNATGEMSPIVTLDEYKHIGGLPDIKEYIDDIDDSISDMNTIISWSSADLSSASTLSWWINDLNKWINSSAYKCMVIPVTPNRAYKVEPIGSGIFIAWLRNATRTHNEKANFCLNNSGRITVPQGTIYTKEAPVDATYLYIGIQANETTYSFSVSQGPVSDIRIQEYISEASATPQGVILSVAASLGNSLIDLNPTVDSEGYVIPDTLQRKNVVRKARQLTGVVWHPLADIPHRDGSYTGGSSVTGVPYSSVKELDKFIGYEVSLHTFMTAVNNPYSLLYTENVSEANSTSAWGKTYHGDNCATYYGTTCSYFSCYCAGLPRCIATGTSNWAEKYACKYVRVYGQSSQQLQIGDIYWKDGHDRIITGLKRDSSGNVSHVQMSESIGLRAIRRQYTTAEEFDALVKSESAVIYRPLELYQNIYYEPSEFVANEGEEISPYVYNDDICCFAGDKACFREGDTIAINYNLKSVGSWTEMELYKNDTLLDTITIDSSVHVVDLTSMELTYGMYKARMKNNSTYSDYTYFEILQTNVTANLVGEQLFVTFNSANGTPLYYGVFSILGGVRCAMDLSREEKAAHTTYANIYRETDLQNPDYPLSSLNQAYVKVYFQGQYGRVTNEPIPITLNS